MVLIMRILITCSFFVLIRERFGVIPWHLSFMRASHSLGMVFIHLYSALQATRFDVYPNLGVYKKLLCFTYRWSRIKERLESVCYLQEPYRLSFGLLYLMENCMRFCFFVHLFAWVRLWITFSEGWHR